MNKRDMLIVASTFVLPCSFFVFQPFLLGPLTFFLLLKPMILASQTISILTGSSSTQLGYVVPAYFNSCLEESSQISSQVEPMSSFDTEVRKLRAFLVCSIIFTVFTCFALITQCTLFCCQGRVLFRPFADDKF